MLTDLLANNNGFSTDLEQKKAPGLDIVTVQDRVCKNSYGFFQNVPQWKRSHGSDSFEPTSPLKLGYKRDRQTHGRNSIKSLAQGFTGNYQPRLKAYEKCNTGSA